MERQDWYFFILTFITGVFIGAFVYLTSFVPTYLSNGFGGEEADASEFSVIGKSYGGFTTPDYIHPAFRLLGNGEYSYIPGGTGENSLEPIEGKLPASLMQDVKRSATELKLNSYERNAENTSCRYYADGVDYEYRIVLDKMSYELDTCTTALGYNTDLSQALDEVWEYLADPGNGSIGSRWRGSDFNEAATNWLRSYFDTSYEEEDDYTACTLEAKQCPDGSYVGRTGPNCQFAPCPGI